MRLYADVELPLRFPPERLPPPTQGLLCPPPGPVPGEPRAEVEDLDGFEGLLKQAFARRRRTLENNLQDSYPKLKEYLRFLNLEGSRRAETLSVVEFVDSGEC